MLEFYVSVFRSVNLFKQTSDQIRLTQTSVNSLSKLCIVFACIAVTGFSPGNLAGKLFFCLDFALELLVKVLEILLV